MKKTKLLMCMVMIFALILSTISTYANEQIINPSIEQSSQVTSGKLYHQHSNTLKYEGQMLNGIPHGQGKYYSVINGQPSLSYEGEYKDGERDGFGKGYDNGRLYYIGMWKNHKKHGFGADFHSNGTLLHIGEFKNGFANGMGIRYLWGEFKKQCIFLGRHYDLSVTEDINKVTVDIPTKKGIANVNGKEVEIDVLDEEKFMKILNDYNTINSLGWGIEAVFEKLTYNGDIDDNNSRVGYGQLINLDGDLLYVGGFKDNKMNGYGLLHEKDSSYIGEFSQNRILGLGAKINEDNEIEQILYTYIDEDIKTQTNKFKLTYKEKKMEHYPIIIDKEKRERALRSRHNYNPISDPEQPDNTFDWIKFKQMVRDYDKKWKKIFEEDTKEYFRLQKIIEEKNENKPKTA